MNKNTLSLSGLARQTFILSLIILLLLSLFSCSLPFANEKSDSKTYITLAEPAFRTIAPGSVDYSASNLKNLVFKGKKLISEGLYDDEIILVEAATYSEISGKKIPIEPGTWDLTLTANLSGAPMVGTVTNNNIVQGTNNKITFTLAADDFDYGGFILTVKFDNSGNKVSKVEAELYKNDRTTLIDSYSVAASDFTVSGSSTSAKFERSLIDDEERLASGNYYMLFSFIKDYDDDRSDVLNKFGLSMYIDKGHWTTWTSNVYDINSIYSIDYKYFLNDGVELDSSSVTPDGGAVFVDSYSARSEEIEIPDVSYDSYIFDGWYSSSSFSEDTRLQKNAGNWHVIGEGDIPTGSETTKTLYARFCKPEFYVDASSTVTDPDGFSLDSAFSTLTNAIAAIEGYGLNLDWTIFINGAIEGEQSLPSSFKTDSAASLTISGLTNSESDYFDGQESGSVFDIATEVPLTFTKIGIKNGAGITSGNDSDKTGGGINVHVGASVTLADDVSITENSGAFGAGVYNKGGTVYISGATISNNTASTYGGGIYNSSDGSANGKCFIYGTTSISSNSCTTTLKYGGGIYNASNCSIYLGYNTENQKSAWTGGITNNTAESGSAIWAAASSYVYFDSGLISGNTGDTDGAFYLMGTGELHISGSARMLPTDNLYFGTYSGSTRSTITIAGELTAELPVMTFNYSSVGLQVLELGSDSDTSLAAEHYKFFVTPQTTTSGGVTKKIPHKIDSSGKLSALEVGDIVFTDSTATSYSADLNLSDELKAAAVGVVYNADDTNGIPKGIMGKTNSGATNSRCHWTNLYGVTYPDDIVSTTTVSGTYLAWTDLTLSTFSGDMDGSDNWSIILNAAGSSASDADFPAFAYANSYATTAGLTDTDFASNWYMPSMPELMCIIQNRTAVENSILAIGGQKFVGQEYWASSLKDTRPYIWYVSIPNENAQTDWVEDGVSNTNGNVGTATGANIVCVRQF